MTYEQKQLLESLLAWSVIGLLFLLRNVHPVFGKIWFFIRWFFIILLATLTINYAKDKVREWWRS